MAVLRVTDADVLLEATSLLDAGELIVVPTDTTYALAADALNDEAVARVFLAKDRGADRPLAVAVGGVEDVGHVALHTPLARALAARFWPGPLSMVLRARPWLPDGLTAGGDSVAVRSPDLAFPRDLARHFGPLVLTSARRAGGPDALTVDDARRMLGAEAARYVDAGTLPGGRTTVVDARGPEAKVLSDGKVPAPSVVEHGRVRP